MASRPVDFAKSRTWRGLTTATATPAVASAAAQGGVVVWGYGARHVPPPAGLTGVEEVAACGDFAMALRGDGTVIAWGDNAAGQTAVPPGLSGVVQVSCGAGALALKEDGTVVAWGRGPPVPEGLVGVTEVASGTGFMPFSLALRTDGTVVAWGSNFYGSTDVPAGLSDVVHIAAGYGHAVALRADGSVVGWGINHYGQTVAPAGLTDVVHVAGGYSHTLALRADGTVVVWGYLGRGGPTNTPPGWLRDVVHAATVSYGQWEFSVAVSTSIRTSAEPAPGGGGGLDVVPNPVGRSTVVHVRMLEAAPVRVAAYDALGREAAVLHEGPLPAGTTALPLDASRLAPGVYVVRAVGRTWSTATRLVVAQ